MNSPFSDPTISLALAPLAPPAGGPGPGTPDEAMAMVKRAQGKFRMAGAAATFTAINNQSDGFVDRDLYADRKSTRLNSSHLGISYAVFCLKKKKKNNKNHNICNNLQKHTHRQ